ncbi:DUF559 domain-containing protein [Schumannella sp. 10F1B-5-1]|uniref:DUF559 domain-containing protein n=1 Tax=Schumannella sp. 10F1B-5-1 TaxID=2590780 RepID=UPI0011320F15|nr:DUF559 domain-containing protein [Schumannella sp. 10F1B-5-1]TPW76911.1 DUF559 domain-containing protein [Schumannella sp. 10F1B-5-1]
MSPVRDVHAPGVAPRRALDPAPRVATRARRPRRVACIRGHPRTPALRGWPQMRDWCGVSPAFSATLRGLRCEGGHECAAPAACRVHSWPLSRGLWMNGASRFANSDAGAMRRDDPLEQTAFSVGDARRSGLSRRERDARHLDRPHHGIRAPMWRDVDTAVDLLPALRVGDRFSHSTAARLWPLPLPSWLESAGPPIHVSAPIESNRTRRPGVIGHRSAHDRAILRHGIPVSEPIRLFLELASVLDLDDLVAVGDALVRDPPVQQPDDPRPWVPLADLTSAVRRARTPDSARARRAMHLVREGSDSPAETRLRLATVRAGLPEAELNGMLHDAVGDEIGRFDLIWRRHRVVAEYDGDQHRTDPVQYDRDIIRFDRATEAGYRVLRFRTRQLYPATTPAVLSIEKALRASRA